MRALIFFLIIFVFVGFASAKVPGIIKHQDSLTNGTGEPAANSDAVQV